ncbi:MAG: hypothetical protein JXR03_11205 [Cyclobacteriaceae bacterium]
MVIKSRAHPKMKSLCYILFILIILNNCTLIAQPQIQKDSIDQEEIVSKALTKALLNSCYVCHNPSVKSHDDIISPPLVSIKYIYKLKYPEKEIFVKKMTDFVLEPSNRSAIMQGPVMRFGVMPDLPLKADEVRRIATYIYENEIEEPSWFPEHFEERHHIKWEGQ